MDNLTILFIVVLVAILVTDAVLTYRSHRSARRNEANGGDSGADAKGNR